MFIMLYRSISKDNSFSCVLLSAFLFQNKVLKDCFANTVIMSHWNSLPPSVTNTQSTEEFRALLI